MKIFSHSEQGHRDNQEDALLIKGNLFVVADGLGGHPHGEKASAEVVRAFDSPKVPEETFLEWMESNILEANENCLQANDWRGSTVSAAYLQFPDLHVAHAGDSRIYTIGGGAVEQITKDHAKWGGITSFVGGITEIECETHDVQYDDYILLLTDGVFGSISGEKMMETCNNAKVHGLNPAENLCKIAIQNGSRDNCTAIVIFLT